MGNEMGGGGTHHESVVARALRKITLHHHTPFGAFTYLCSHMTIFVFVFIYLVLSIHKKASKMMRKAHLCTTCTHKEESYLFEI